MRRYQIFTFSCPYDPILLYQREFIKYVFFFSCHHPITNICTTLYDEIVIDHVDVKNVSTIQPAGFQPITRSNCRSVLWVLAIQLLSLKQATVLNYISSCRFWHKGGGEVYMYTYYLQYVRYGRVGMDKGGDVQSTISY